MWPQDVYIQNVKIVLSIDRMNTLYSIYKDSLQDFMYTLWTANK